MIQKLIVICGCVVALTLAAVIFSDRAIAQEAEQHYSRKQLRELVANSTGANSYRQLAEYFHHEKQVYRAKADEEMHEYAKFFSYYHPKFPTGAENAARLHQYYARKADRAGRLATYYDDLLVKNGFSPVSEPLTVSAVNRSTAGATNQPSKAALHSASPRTAQTGFETRSPR